jgi:hypothetical protein
MPHAKPRRAKKDDGSRRHRRCRTSLAPTFGHPRTRAPVFPFASSRLRVSQSRCGAGNASREAAKGAKKGGEVAGFVDLRASLDLSRGHPRTRLPALPPFASSRLRVSQRRCGAGNASREAAKGAKKDDGSRRFCGPSRESGPWPWPPALGLRFQQRSGGRQGYA